MDKLVINKALSSKKTVIDKDMYVVFSNELEDNNIKIEIKDCKATIIDNSFLCDKEINAINSDVVVVDISNKSNENSLMLINDGSNIEYNIIDLLDDNINFKLEEQVVGANSKTDINIASICYKNKNKNYVINTSNLDRFTTSSVNCFGIVKDNSNLNYDVTSFIKNGAKKSVVRQNSSILLFDEASNGKSNPILVIEENDVKANHGSSIGKIDDDTMFYLCSRGLSKGEATNLICLGKVQYLINKIEDTSIRESLVNKFRERMV